MRNSTLTGEDGLCNDEEEWGRDRARDATSSFIASSGRSERDKESGGSGCSLVGMKRKSSPVLCSRSIGIRTGARWPPERVEVVEGCASEEGPDKPS